MRGCGWTASCDLPELQRLRKNELSSHLAERLRAARRAANHMGRRNLHPSTQALGRLARLSSDGPIPIVLIPDAAERTAETGSELQGHAWNDPTNSQDTRLVAIVNPRNALELDLCTNRKAGSSQLAA